MKISFFIHFIIGYFMQPTLVIISSNILYVIRMGDYLPSELLRGEIERNHRYLQM